MNFVTYRVLVVSACAFLHVHCDFTYKNGNQPTVIGATYMNSNCNNLLCNRGKITMSPQWTMAGSQPASKLTIIAAAICIYAFFDKCENALSSFGDALVDSSWLNNVSYMMTIERLQFCVSVLYFVTTMTTMTKNRITAQAEGNGDGIKRKSQKHTHTHMQTLLSTHIHLKKEILCACGWHWWHDQMWWRWLSHALHRTSYTNIHFSDQPTVWSPSS